MPVIPFQTALKEWSIAIDALTAGEMIMLLRKGGIREAKFEIEAPNLWLYPTYEHQKPELLKAAYRDRVTTVPSGWHPEQVPIQAWATITHELPIDQVDDRSGLDRFLPYHIWNEEFASVRLNWKPRMPLTVLLLRVYQLNDPVTIQFDSSYGGCRSWIQLQEKLDHLNAVPVLSDVEYGDRVQEILDQL